MLRFLLGVVVGGVLAVTASQAAQAFVAMADWLPDEVLEYITDADQSL
jgi:hypothetical protein